MRLNIKTRNFKTLADTVSGQQLSILFFSVPRQICHSDHEA